MAGPAAKKPVRMESRDPAYDLMELTGKRPEYRQMMDYLMARRAVPEVQLRYLGDSLHGVFEHPGAAVTSYKAAGPNGRISVADYQSQNTLIHETAHAADRQMAIQYSREKYHGESPTGRTPFTDAYEKFIYQPDLYRDDPGKLPSQQLMKLIAPTWTAAEADYRSTTNEARAFGIGNSAVPAQADSKAPPHVDATLATEFLILLDLATRSQKAKPQSQGR